VFYLQLIGVSVVKSNSNDYFFRSKTMQKCPLIFDVGSADDADLSEYFLKKKNALVYAVDPTKKHSEALIEKTKISPNFSYIPKALTGKNGRYYFFHNEKHQSGSLKIGHINEDIQSSKYEVDGFDLETLFQVVPGKIIDYVKIDIEGAELEVFENASEETIKIANQYFIEFHPHAFKDYNVNRMSKIIDRFLKLGYKVETADKINYLFSKS
jgi:FkbM family methyltransferase